MAAETGRATMMEMADNGAEPVRLVWARVRSRYDDDGGRCAGPATREEVQAVEAQLADYYASTFQAKAFRFPDELRELLTLVGPERHCAGSFGSGVYGFNWYTPAAIASGTVYETNLWSDCYASELGLWTCIA